MIEVEDRHGSYLLPRALAAWIPAGVAHTTSLHRVRSGSILFAPQLIPNAGDRVRIIQVSSLMREMVVGAMRWPLVEQQDATGQAYFKALAMLCAEWIEDEAPLRLPVARDRRIMAAAAYMRTNLTHQNMAELCQVAGASERTLRRRFQSDLGMSCEEYRRRARLLKAAALLSEGKLAIGEIAVDVGFESQSAFARAFKELTGSTPRAFRSNSASL
ncbi:MAG: AraC family transcriptional regulator [Sphingobium sp.]